MKFFEGLLIPLIWIILIELSMLLGWMETIEILAGIALISIGVWIGLSIGFVLNAENERIHNDKLNAHIPLDI